LQLIGFERVSLAPGESKTVRFAVTVRSLSRVDKHGARHTLAGEHKLLFSRGHGDVLGGAANPRGIGGPT
jgi:beta-glucosidase